MVTAAFSGAGSGTADDPYEISTCIQLQEMKNNLSAYYELVNDIDCSETVNWNGGAGFEPVGDKEDNSFRGILNGNEYVISQLFINRPSESNVGLFGYTRSNISNIGLENVKITGDDYVGGLVGGIFLSYITNSYVTGSVSGNDQVGGLVGRNSYSDITNSYATGSVFGEGNVGGLVGVNFYSTITNSYATGSVSGDTSVGGLVGSNTVQFAPSTITNSYATGSVSGDSQVGGLVGHNKNYSTIINSYATGSVSGNYYVGGLVGRNNRSYKITSTYWDTQTSGTSIGVGVGSALYDDRVFGRTTAEMMQQATFVDWDFVDIWRIDEGVDYPHLRWEDSGSGSVCEPATVNDLLLNITIPCAKLGEVNYQAELIKNQDLDLSWHLGNTGLSTCQWNAANCVTVSETLDLTIPNININGSYGTVLLENISSPTDSTIKFGFLEHNSLLNANTLFYSIESQYSQYFPTGSSTNTLGIDSDIAYYRIYGANGLALYKGDLYYLLPQNTQPDEIWSSTAEWKKFSNISDARVLFCNGDCNSGEYCSIDNTRSEDDRKSECVYPIDAVGLINNSIKDTAVDIFKMYLTLENHATALRIFTGLEVIKEGEIFLKGIKNYTDRREQILYILEFSLKKFSLFGGLISDGSIVTAYRGYSDSRTLGPPVELVGSVEFYLLIEEDGWWFFEPNISDASVSLYPILQHNESQGVVKYIIVPRSENPEYTGSYLRGEGYAFYDENERISTVTSGLYLVKIVWEGTTYFETVFVEPKVTYRSSILLD